MRVFVSVGTDHHPFDRLVGWASAWGRDHPDDELVVQHGTSGPPAWGSSVDVLGRTEMLRELARADAVVLSCGPGAVMDARAAGRFPVVVARRAPLGEHVDDHQLAFARHLATHGLARCVEDEEGFRSVLAEVAAQPHAFRVEPSAEAPHGIHEIGRLVDRLVYGDESRRG